MLRYHKYKKNLLDKEETLKNYEIKELENLLLIKPEKGFEYFNKSVVVFINDLIKALKNKVPPVLYVFELNKRYDIDGDVPWNTAKWINHSCNPNCETEDDNGKMWIMATRDINSGEELTYDYGFDFDPETFKDNPCLCGSKECIGYIVKKEHWNRLKRHLDKIQAEKREIKNTPLLTIRR